jgi:iron complex outermembrane recepter protein
MASNKGIVFHVLGVVGTALAVAGPVQAQTSSGGTAADNGSGEKMETVMVTGEKRSQSVAKTPATVDVVDQQKITELALNNLESLNRIIPGFQFDIGNGGNMSLSVRGVGTTSAAQSYEQSVAPYINGVYLGGNNRDFSWPLFDVDHIEVYKGTQSGISGQNTSVGYVDIVTTLPGSEFGGYVTLSKEFVNDGYHAEGAVDIPVTSDFAVRASGYFNQRGGWIHNVITGHNLGDQQTYAGRLTAVWSITNNVTAQFYAEYDHERQVGSGTTEVDKDLTGGYATYIAPYFTWSPDLGKTAMQLTTPDPSLGVTYGGDSGVLAHTFKGSARIDAQLGGGFTLTSVTAASSINDKLSVDMDTSPATISTLASPAAGQQLLQSAKYDQITEDLHIASPEADRLSYILGLWYRHADYSKTTAIFQWPAPGVALDIYWPFKQTTDNRSVYGDFIYRFTDKLKLGGTVRYTDETKPSQVQGIGNFPATLTPFPLYKTTINSSFFDGSVRLQYAPEEGVDMYVMYSHGTKTGALVDLVASGVPQIAKPEVIQTYEIGTKLSWAEAALTFNASVFHMDIHNYQDEFTANVGGTTLFVASNTNAYSNGIDASVQWNPLDSLTLGSSVEYLAAHDITNGGTFARSPKWQVTGNARYEYPLPWADLHGALFSNFEYKDSYFNYPLGNPNRTLAEVPQFVTADVGTDVITQSGLKFTLLCKNCTNTYEHVRLTNGTFGPTKAPGYYDYIPETRTVTLQATYEF